MGNDVYDGAAPAHRSLDWIVAEILAVGVSGIGLIIGTLPLQVAGGCALAGIFLYEAVHLIRRSKSQPVVEPYPRPEELIPEAPPEAVYRSPSSGAAIGSILTGGFGLMLEALIAKLVLVDGYRGKAIAALILLPIAAGFFIGLGVINLLSRMVVALYPHGFLYARGKHIDFCTWERVAAIWSWHRVIPNTVPIYKYWITRDDGMVYTFKSTRIDQIEKLGKRILEQVHDRMLAAVMDGYAAGNVVQFGPVGIDPNGLHYRGEFLPWERITGICADAEGDFVVKKCGKAFAWIELSTARIPNFPILLALLGERASVAACC